MKGAGGASVKVLVGVSQEGSSGFRWEFVNAGA